MAEYSASYRKVARVAIPLKADLVMPSGLSRCFPRKFVLFCWESYAILVCKQDSSLQFCWRLFTGPSNFCSTRCHRKPTIPL